MSFTAWGRALVIALNPNFAFLHTAHRAPQAVISQPYQHQHGSMHSSTITKRAYARVGLLGNPSDGYHGACISFSLSNFWAEVSLTPSTKLCFLPNPAHDIVEFDSMASLKARLDTCGFYGGVRLLQVRLDACMQDVLACKQCACSPVRATTTCFLAGNRQGVLGVV